MTDWNKLIRLTAPALVGAAAGGQHGAVLRGYLGEQERIDQERQRQAQQESHRRELGARTSLELLNQLQQEADPLRFEQLRGAIATHADALGVDPSMFDQMPGPDGHAQKLKELTDSLSRLNGYDLEQLAQSGASLKLKDGSTIPVRDAIRATGQYPVDGSGQPILPPAKKPELTSLAIFAKSKNKAPADLTWAEMQEFNKQEATSKKVDAPVDPMTASLRQLQIEGQRLRNEQLRTTGTAPKSDNLPPSVLTRVQSRISNFDNLPAVKNTQTMAEAANFAQGLNPNTKNPADDQALIYAFAKAMDPNSVVREGEYATVQKYAQSWAQSMGFDAARMFSNTPFLTATARQNMKTTILQKFKAAQGQYDTIRKSYASQINKITGGADGDSWLTDYAQAFPTDGTGQPALMASHGDAPKVVYYDVNGNSVKR